MCKRAGASSLRGVRTPAPSVARLAAAGGRTPRLVRRAAGGNAGNGESDEERRIREQQEALQQRILSGEFTDAGSTKERMTRPLRQALAQDPIGIGKRAVIPAVHTYAAWIVRPVCTVVAAGWLALLYCSNVSGCTVWRLNQ